MRVLALLTLVAFLGMPGVGPPPMVFAQPAESAAEPASAETPVEPAPPQTQALSATIAEVKGNVRWRAGEDAEWQVAQVNQRLEQGAEIRTSFASYVKLILPPDQIVAIDRLSNVKLLQAFFDEAKSKYQTDLGMEYGRVRYDVQTAGFEHEATIYSPNATLAVRGTDAQLDDMPGYPPRITSYHGRIVGDLEGKTVVMGGKQRVSASAERPTPADNAIGETHLDPNTDFAARTDGEFLLIEDFPAIGGYDPVLLQALAERRLGFEFANVFVGTVQIEESLFFLLGFAGIPTVTDVGLSVTDPGGNVISETMPVSPTGGFHAGDDIADAEGNGEESVIFPLGVVPKGTYTVRVEFFPQSNLPGGEVDGAIGFVQLVGNNLPFRNFGPFFLSPDNTVFQTNVDINELPKPPTPVVP